MSDKIENVLNHLFYCLGATIVPLTAVYILYKGVFDTTNVICGYLLIVVPITDTIIGLIYTCLMLTSKEKEKRDKMIDKIIEAIIVSIFLLSFLLPVSFAVLYFYA